MVRRKEGEKERRREGEKERRRGMMYLQLPFDQDLVF